LDATTTYTAPMFVLRYKRDGHERVVGPREFVAGKKA